MSFDHYLRDVMSDAQRGIGAGTLRAGLTLAEPFYSTAVRWRNRGYDRHPQRIRRLPKSVISIGNITTGGTGKTPIVRWLASRLREQGLRVAILARGYRAVPGTLGDEQRMLDSLLNGKRDGSPSFPSSRQEDGKTAADCASDAASPGGPIVIQAHPDRFAAGLTALEASPGLDVFLLDDGFQHRRLGRDLDIVLVNAIEPFGFGHVLPRGLLREPLAGLKRAGAIVVTHASAVQPAALDAIDLEIRRHNSAAPIYRADHAPIGSRAAGESALRPLADLKSRRTFAFCGLASPVSFESDVRSAGALVGHRWFGDHHHYTSADLATVRVAAREAGADVLVTTEKDWVKLADLPGTADPELPIWRLDVAARFMRDDEGQLLKQINQIVGHR